MRESEHGSTRACYENELAQRGIARPDRVVKQPFEAPGPPYQMRAHRSGPSSRASPHTSPKDHSNGDAATLIPVDVLPAVTGKDVMAGGTTARRRTARSMSGARNDRSEK